MGRGNTMNRRVALLTIVAASLVYPLALCAAPKKMELFGVSLKGVSREQLRQTLKQNGVSVLREDNRYWVDNYSAEGLLEEASVLAVGYVVASGTFAYAEYTFPSHMDTKQVARIIDMVATKYGRPTSLKGYYGLGEVTARWNMGSGMEWRVSRG